MTRFDVKPLGSIALFKNGVNFTKAQMGRGHRVINVKNLYCDTICFDPEGLDLVDLGAGFSKKENGVRQGDIFFVRSSVKRDGIGVVALAREDDDQTTHCGFVIRCRLYDNDSDPAFIAYSLRSPLMRAAIMNLSGGAAITNISQTALAGLLVPTPPRPIQQRIASILGAYDDLIEVNRRRIAVLEEMARRLFEEWFVRFQFPGQNDCAFTGDGQQRLPQGWSWTNLGTLAEEVRDAVQPTDVDEETPYVGLEHIPRRSTTLDAWGRVEEVTSTKLRFRRGDILFGKIRPYFHKVAWAPFEGVCSSDAIVIRPREAANSGLVLAIASSDEFVAHSVQTSNGTKMPRANWSVLVKYPVPNAPDTIRLQFNAFVMPSVEMAAVLHDMNTKLTASRDHLLPRLISGELSVTTAERELEDAA